MVIKLNTVTYIFAFFDTKLVFYSYQPLVIANLLCSILYNCVVFFFFNFACIDY